MSQLLVFTRSHAQVLAQYISTTGLTATAANNTVTVSGSPTRTDRLELDITPELCLKINWNAPYAGNPPLPSITVIGSGENIKTNGSDTIAFFTAGNVLLTGGNIYRFIR
ncbi:hypothetical protein FACS1894187_03600 [Synergistales bacterium]|nr:hypothetical protein FACS1894187_03600 [Synergistales bacterium]